MNYYLEAFKKYVDFEGRANRKEFWIYMLVHYGIMGCLLYLPYEFLGLEDSLITTIPVFLYLILTMIPTYAVMVRRLHDTNRSGFWVFIKFIPLIGIIVLFIFLIQNSDPLKNQYGLCQKSKRSH